MESSIQHEIDAWLNDPAIAEADKEEIRSLVAAGNEKELTDRFYRSLAFGTGGLRGVIGAGLNRMNVYTVGAAAQGLANYIAQQGEAAKASGMAIAHDCRRMSDVFARRTACVMAGNGIKAYLFSELRPTPELSFAIRHLGCTSGVVVTASHNPPEYNGFKAYWSDGVQVVPPHDKLIIEQVEAVGGFGNVQTMDFEEAQAKGLIVMIDRDVDEAFLREAQQSCLSPELSREHGKDLKIVFTNLHGTGGTLIPEALRRRGFEQVIEVPEQAEPDGEFPTVESPNPEEGAALTLGIELAKKENASLVIGTDPDADRVGIAVRDDTGAFQLVTGNRIASLLTYYICEQLKAKGNFPRDAVLITTVVSGDMMKDIARAYGAEVIETLTGFKWIGERIEGFEQARVIGKPSKTYIFGAEESYGYMPATFTRDKDAVTSTAYIADVAAWAASQGKTLYELLNDLFAKFGYYHEGAKSITLKGKEGADKIKAMMNALRTAPPSSIGATEVKTVADLMNGHIISKPGGEVVGRYDLPKADVVMFTLVDGTKVIARPSGTEPKIKFYVLMRVETDNVSEAAAACEARIKTLVDDIVAKAG